MSETDNVVGFVAQPPVTQRPRQMPRRKERRGQPRTCEHRQTEIDDVLRVVECKGCGARLDPITVLLDIANQWSDYEVVRMHRELQHYKTAAWYVQQIKLRERCAPEERGLTFTELVQRHNEHGCPPERIRVTTRMLECYCGVGVSRSHYPDFEARVLEAQRRRKTIRPIPSKGETPSE